MTHALLLSLLLAATPASDVTEVVVFPRGAEVTRAQSLPCAPGLTARFPALPPGLDAGAVRAHVRGAASAQALSVRLQQHRREAAYGEERARAEQERTALAAQQRELAEAQALAEREGALGTHYARAALAKLSRALLLPGATPRAWGQALDAALEASLSGARARAALSARGEALEARAAELEQRVASLGAAAQRLEVEAVVEVACAGDAEVRVELAYRVPHAGWTPAYEARADEPGKALQLTAFADVRQSTGEDWRDARVVLSTALPQAQATPPELRVLHVAAQPRATERRVLARRDEEAQRAEARGEGAVEDAAVEGLAAQAQGLSVRLPLPDRATVPADGRVTRLVVGRVRLPATFALRAVPRLSEGAFRVADVVNTAPFPLLPGPVDSFRASGFVGRSPLERVAQGAPFTLTLGMDEEVRVVRSVVEEVQRKEGLFGGKRRFRYAYRVEAANYGPRAEVLEVVETVPVAEVEDVRVELDAAATAPALHVKDQGRLTYRLALSGGGGVGALDVAFHVDVPRAWDTGAGI